MAGGFIQSGSREKKFIWIRTCFVAVFCGFIFGYDLGISGIVTSMNSFPENFFPKFYQKKNKIKSYDDSYCTFNNQTLTLFISSLYLAALIASWFVSSITRLFGRRHTITTAAVLFSISIILNTFAQNVWMLVVGRILLGFGIGCVNQSIPIYLSEVAPYKYRGALNMTFQLGITIGISVAHVLNYIFAKMNDKEVWKYSWSLPLLYLTFTIIYYTSFLPESPSSLIERGLNEKAKIELFKIRETTDVEEEFKDLVAASESSKKVKHPSLSLLKKQYRPQLIFAIAIPFFQQLTGMNVIVFYAPILFKSIGFGTTASLMLAMITWACNVIATLVSILTVDKFGRRTLFLEGGIQMFFGQIMVMAAIAWKFGFNGNPGILPEWYAIVVVCGICVYVAGFAWSWGPLGWLVPSENFPLEVRSAAQSINVSVNMIFTFIIIQIFTPMFCHMKFGLLVFFACFVVVMSIFICRLLPETKGVSIEKMHIVWQSHPYWKKFVKPINAGSTPEEF